MPSTILLKPAVDWLTVTTTDEENGAAMLSTFQKILLGGKSRKRKLEGFTGTATNYGFLGMGEFGEERQRRIMLQAWGGCAEDARCELAEVTNEVNCSRLDCQVTVQMPHDYRARRLADVLSDAQWEGRKRQIRLIEDSGLDTVEIGSRKSNRFIRIYVKEVNGIHWIRFEVEYKKERAQRMFDYLKGRAGRRIGSVLRQEWEWLPETTEGALTRIGEWLVQAAVMVKHGERVNKSDKVKWLREQVSPSIERGVYDHDEGEEIREIVRGWYSLVQDLDNPLTREDFTNKLASKLDRTSLL